MRTDLSAPDAPKQGEVLGELGDNATNAGTAGRGPDGASVPPPSNPPAEAGKDEAPGPGAEPRGR